MIRWQFGVFILVFDRRSIHCALCMFVCISVNAELVWVWMRLYEMSWLVTTPRGPAKERTPLQWGWLPVNVRRETFVGVSCVFQLSKDILNVHKWKRKLLLHDATESVYIGGLCNRLLLVFGTLCLGSGGGVGYQIFSFRVTKQIFAHCILIVFCTKDTCNEMATSQLK